MILKNEDINDFKTHIEINTLKNFGIKIVCTKKDYGDIKNIEKKYILKDFNLDSKTLISCFQTHSDNVELVNDISKTYFDNTDGLLSSNSEFALLIKFADCLPIFLYDEKNKVFGAIHSGWEGSYKSIILKAIQSLEHQDLSKINIIFGPSISSSNYEVQEDFYLKFKEKFSINIINKSFTKIDKKILFDNQLFNFQLLKEYGLDENKIYINNFCTFDGDIFHSYRRDKNYSGRNGGIIYKI